MNDLLAKITAPIGSVKSAPEAASATVATPATAATPVAEKDLVSPAPLDAQAVDETALLTPSAPSTPAAPAPGDVAAPEAKRKRGRPPGTKNPPKTPETDIESPSTVPNIADIQTAAQAVVVDYKLMAEATFDLTTGVAATTLGPEWQPRNEDEKQMVCVPLARYFEYKQVKDLPPNLALALVVVAYSAPRLREPGTASKLRMLWAWAKEKIRSLRTK